MKCPKCNLNMTYFGKYSNEVGLIYFCPSCGTRWTEQDEEDGKMLCAGCGDITDGESLCEDCMDKIEKQEILWESE
jgi:Zn-finger nucleic acid-binding protein